MKAFSSSIISGQCQLVQYGSYIKKTNQRAHINLDISSLNVNKLVCFFLTEQLLTYTIVSFRCTAK